MLFTVCKKFINFMCRPMQTTDCVHHIHGCCLSQLVSQMRPWRLLPATGVPSECLLLSGGEHVFFGLLAYIYVGQGPSKHVTVIDRYFVLR